MSVVLSAHWHSKQTSVKLGWGNNFLGNVCYHGKPHVLLDLYLFKVPAVTVWLFLAHDISKVSLNHFFFFFFLLFVTWFASDKPVWSPCQKPTHRKLEKQTTCFLRVTWFIDFPCWWQTYGSEPIKKWDTEDHWNRRWIDGLPSIMIGTNLVIQWSLHDSAAKRLSPNEVFKLYYMHQVECHCILSVVLTCFHLLYTWKLSGFSI